jgi:hypothetical protein
MVGSQGGRGRGEKIPLWETGKEGICSVGDRGSGRGQGFSLPAEWRPPGAGALFLGGRPQLRAAWAGGRLVEGGVSVASEAQCSL